MAEKDSEDAFLEAHFAAARRQAERMPEALAARMLADATEVQAARAAGAERAAAGRGGSGAASGLVGQLMRVLGGWPTMGGLAAACAVGVWLGVAPPDFLPDPIGMVLQQSGDVNLLDSYALSSVLAEDG